MGRPASSVVRRSFRARGAMGSALYVVFILLRLARAGPEHRRIPDVALTPGRPARTAAGLVRHRDGETAAIREFARPLAFEGYP
ncbi:hypothetical protein GCM10010270_20390 [Streptomyces violaceus]|nr:hypothetical protein GCM10010270_20390 [Streptomyces janthinus]